MELSELQQTTTSSHGAAGKPPQEEVRSPVLAEICVETRVLPHRPSVRAADELSDEEAEAFFFV